MECLASKSEFGMPWFPSCWRQTPTKVRESLLLRNILRAAGFQALLRSTGHQGIQSSRFGAAGPQRSPNPAGPMSLFVGRVVRTVEHLSTHDEKGTIHQNHPRVCKILGDAAGPWTITCRWVNPILVPSVLLSTLSGSAGVMPYIDESTSLETIYIGLRCQGTISSLHIQWLSFTMLHLCGSVPKWRHRGSDCCNEYIMTCSIVLKNSTFFMAAHTKIGTCSFVVFKQ